MKRSLLDRWGVCRVDARTVHPLTRDDYRTLRDDLRRQHSDPRDAELVRTIMAGTREMRAVLSSDPVRAVQVDSIVQVCYLELAYRAAARESGRKGGAQPKPRRSHQRRDDRQHTVARMSRLTRRGFGRVAAILRIAGEDSVSVSSVKRRLARIFRDK